MTTDDLKTLLDFHYWARDRALAAAKLTPDQFTRDMGNSFNSVRDTLVHLYSADWGWYELYRSLPIGQMVQHVVNHASYHRGQLTMMFRQLGVDPADSMDLIRYYREQSAGV